MWEELAFQICRFDQAWVLSRMRVEITALPKWRDVDFGKTLDKYRKLSFCKSKCGLK
jgi:hypothetical protein